MPAIRCARLVKRYADVVAVAGLDLTVETGECFGLLGPNGAGKTTTIEILEGLTPPDAGEVAVLGTAWHDGSGGRALQERLGIQLQETQLADKLTVEETLRLFRSFYRRAHSVDEVLRLVELEEKRRVWVNKLSGGQKQRLSVVAIMDQGRVVALGSPQNLIGSRGAEHVVEFALADGAAAGLADELGGLPGVRAVRAGPERTALTVAEVHRTLPALLALLERRGAALSLLTTHHATLEDVFVSLTGRQLRDA